jgi:hypothetical protein
LNKLQKWMAKATTAEKAELAKRAGTTIGTLRQIAGGYRTDGKLRCGAVMAMMIQHASSQMPQHLPVLKASDFCKELRGLSE